MQTKSKFFQVYITDVSPLNNDYLFELLYNKVPNYRQKKIDTLRNKDSKNLSLGAGILLSYALKTLNLNEKDLEVEWNSNGKPSFKNQTNLHFSISHSGKFAVCAISNQNIGIDIETPRKTNLKIANRFFSSQDNRLIQSSENPEIEFTKLWTLKESYAKLKGLPLTEVLKKYDFSDCSYKTIQSHDYILTICSESTHLNQFSDTEIAQFFITERAAL